MKQCIACEEKRFICLVCFKKQLEHGGNEYFYCSDNCLSKNKCHEHDDEKIFKYCDVCKLGCCKKCCSQCCDGYFYYCIQHNRRCRDCSKYCRFLLY